VKALPFKEVRRRSQLSKAASQDGPVVAPDQPTEYAPKYGAPNVHTLPSHGLIVHPKDGRGATAFYDVNGTILKYRSCIYSRAVSVVRLLRTRVIFERMVRLVAHSVCFPSVRVSWHRANLIVDRDGRCSHSVPGPATYLCAQTGCSKAPSSYLVTCSTMVDVCSVA
jgi:hypothetical protein